MKKNKHCKKLVFMAICVSIITFTACNQKTNSGEDAIVEIDLSDAQIDVDGKKVGSNISDAVYVANDIIYYEAGKDFYYGEGTEADAHESEESLDHIVVHITQPGTYRITGKLSKGQIAVDLGEDAKDDPEAVVTLILNGADITCQVAPAVIFYNVYECGNDDVDSASSDIDTQAAGANIIIADDTVNTVNGSYVDKIHKLLKCWNRYSKTIIISIPWSMIYQCPCTVFSIFLMYYSIFRKKVYLIFLSNKKPITISKFFYISRKNCPTIFYI